MHIDDISGLGIYEIDLDYTQIGLNEEHARELFSLLGQKLGEYLFLVKAVAKEKPYKFGARTEISLILLAASKDAALAAVQSKLEELETDPDSFYYDAYELDPTLIYTIHYAGIVPLDYDLKWRFG